MSDAQFKISLSGLSSAPSCYGIGRQSAQTIQTFEGVVFAYWRQKIFTLYVLVNETLSFLLHHGVLDLVDLSLLVRALHVTVLNRV